MSNSLKPLIVESNRKVLLETQSKNFSEVRDQVSVFLNLIKSPERFYTYHLTKISLWNGFAIGLDADKIICILEKYSKFPIPPSICQYINELYRNYGIFELIDHNQEKYELVIKNESIGKKIIDYPEIRKLIEYNHSIDRYFVNKELKGILKSSLTKANYPVKDFCHFEDGDFMNIRLNDQFKSRDYQISALKAFLGNSNLILGGCGVLVMPCGSGKTIIGILAINHFKMSTLIITPNIISLKQWKNELLQNTDIQEEEIGEYSSQIKKIRKITLATYQILTYRKDKKSSFQHLSLFHDRNWGLIIYDEIHMLPANMFRYVTSIQSKRRLGLTATLVREDGRESDVFSLIGPKKFDLPWKELEAQKHIAEVKCFEIKMGMDEMTERNYFTNPSEIGQYRIASENPSKLEVIKKILELFPNHQTLVIGQYISQLEKIALLLKSPLLTGKTLNDEREKLYQKFNNREINPLIVSKVANFAVDLPNAEIAIQISGSFGSRQEEAQRLGRVIRPKENHDGYFKENPNQAFFFSLITQHTKEEIFAQNRKSFLVSQGYSYHVMHQKEFTNLQNFELQKK